jgi:surface protein
MTNLDLRTLNVSKVQDMSNCFENCKVATIDLGTWNTESVTNMDNMFKGAEFSTLYIHNFNTSNVRTMRYMFADIGKDATSRGTLFQSSNGHLNLSALSGTNSRIANLLDQ